MSDVQVVSKSSPVVDLDKDFVTKRLYRILVKAAEEKSTVSYEQLTEELGLVMAPHHYGQYFTPMLDAINNWCRERHIPPLSALVIRKSGVKKGLSVASFFNHIVEHTEPGESIDHVVVRDHSGNPVSLSNVGRRRLTEFYKATIYRHYDITNL